MFECKLLKSRDMVSSVVFSMEFHCLANIGYANIHSINGWMNIKSENELCTPKLILEIKGKPLSLEKG